MKNNVSAIIFSVAIIISAIALGNAYSKKYDAKGTVSVTGLGKTDFTSDLIVWEGFFSTNNFNLKQAYNQLSEEKTLVKEYLVSKGINESQIVFESVKTNNNTKPKYSNLGEYVGEEFAGYQLSQSIKIESREVEKIEKISREITELLNQGVTFYSEAPRYYYTKLADLKIEMISKATEDARVRAEKIAEFSGGKLAKLISAQMGIFQITGQNSKEDYSWGGTFNTNSKEKTASITMKLVYKAD